MIHTKGGRWVNDGCSGNDLEVKILQGTRHFGDIFVNLMENNER